MHMVFFGFLLTLTKIFSVREDTPGFFVSDLTLTITIGPGTVAALSSPKATKVTQRGLLVQWLRS